MEMKRARPRPRWWLAVAVASFALMAVIVGGRPGTVSAQDQAISIANFAFSPANIQVSAGSTITWTNNDSVAHSVTADDGSFDSGLIQPGASYSHTFDTAGTIAYHCSVHPNMTAEVVVLAATAGSTAPAAATTAPASSSGGTASSTTLPNTGAGTGSDGHLGLMLLAIGIVGILGGAGLVVRWRHVID